MTIEPARQWRSIEVEKPDSDRTVELFDRTQEKPEERVWPGWYDKPTDSFHYVGGEPAKPTHWCERLTGPLP